MELTLKADTTVALLFVGNLMNMDMAHLNYNLILSKEDNKTMTLFRFIVSVKIFKKIILRGTIVLPGLTGPYYKSKHIFFQTET